MADTAELRDLSRLLGEALGLPPGRRQAWLDGLADPDRRHRATLARLLAESDDLSDAPLAHPPVVGLLRALGT